MIVVCWHIFVRDCYLQALKGSGLLLQLGFLLVIASLFAFGVGADSDLLQQVSVALIWVSLLLSSLLSLSKLFEEDFEDGSLQLLWMQAIPPELLVLTKFLAHWCVNLLPMLFILPLLAEMFSMPTAWLMELLLLLPIVMLFLTAVGGLGAALILGAKRAVGLLGVVVFPLYVPILIFATSATSNMDEAVRGDAFILLNAMAVLLVPLAVVLSALAVQKNIENT